MMASQKGRLAKDAGPFPWLVSMGNRRTPSQRPSAMPGLNLRDGSDLEKAVLYISIKGLSGSCYFAAVIATIH